MRTIAHTTFLLTFFLTVILPSRPLYAQVSLVGLERPLQLSISPEYPSPREEVRLSVSSFGMDLPRSTISWFVDGKRFVEGDGMTSAAVKTGALGSETRVTVVATDGIGLTGSAETMLRPTEIDLLWTTDSYVPPFYGGHRLVGSGARVQAEALVRFRKTDGTMVKESDIVYSWYRDTKRFAYGRGISHVSLAAPTLFAREQLRVVAESADQRFIGSASESIETLDPAIELYENHPLFGILYHRALIGSVATLENEQLVTAVPYFAAVASPRTRELLYDWSVNENHIEPDPKRGDTITIAANGYTGPARIALTITSLSDIFMRAVGKWELVFSESRGIFGENPFVSPQK